MTNRPGQGRGLGVAGALKAAGREIDHEMLAHLVDHGLHVLLLAGLLRLFGKATFPGCAAN